MATKAKEITVRKDKKVTTSISNTREQGNTTSKQPSSASTSTDKPKPTPHYLRPTLSSKPEPPVKPHVKKPGNEDSANPQSAQLLRRRSFDRPPPASRTFTSPDPKRPGSRDKTSLRSSSFSSSTRITPKPALERNSKSFKPVKSQIPTASRTVSRASSFSKSNERSRNASGTKVPRGSETGILVPETNVQDNNEETSSVPESEEMVNVDSEAQSVVSELEEESKKHPDDVISDELDNPEDDKLQDFDNQNISEEQSASPAVEIKEPETESHVESDEHQHNPAENQRNVEESDDVVDHHDEASATIEEVRDKEEENANETADASAAELQGEQKQEEDIRDDEHAAPEETKTKTEEEHVPASDTEERVEERPSEAAARMPGGQGKKESPAAYNDVIEETKNKLMEKRKNKVKALVGAFETVIDYETAASK